MLSTRFHHQCITEYVQVQGNVVQLQIHSINSTSSNQSCQPQFWFKDRHLQEVIQLIKIPLFKQSEACSSIPDKDKKKEEPVYNILSGNTIRLAYTFKKSLAHQYFLIMNDCENNFDQFENIHLKYEKMVIFVCQIEKGIENLLKAVNDTEGRTSSQQTVSISSYFTQLPQNNTENSRQSLDNLETKDSSDICSSDPSKKEKLKSIVSRVKRLRQRRTSKHKSCQRLAESKDSEKIAKKPVSSFLEANGHSELLTSLQHSDILRESNHSLNSNLTSDNWVENLSFNSASLSDSLISYESDRISQDNNSNGSTSSDENLPYYGISDKCSDAGGLSSVSSSFEPDFNPDAPLASPTNSPTKFSNSTHSHPPTVVGTNQKGDGKIKSRCKKKMLKAPSVKELKDSKVKPEVSKDSASGSRLGIMSVHDFTPKQIMRLIKGSEDYLRSIFEGKTASWRHEMYKTGRPERHRLNFQCQFGNLSSKQLDIIMEGLFNIFCKHHLKYEDYVSKVMLAEAIIKIHMDIYQISHKEAEDMLQ